MVFINESNNTISTAVDTGLTGIGSYIAEGIIGDNLPEGSPSDVDILKVDLQAGQSLTVNIEALASGSGLSSQLRVFQADGQEMASSDPWNEWDDPSLTFTAPTAGSYFIGVSSDWNYSYDPNAENSSDGYYQGNYTININVAPNEPPIANADELDGWANTTLTFYASQLWSNDSDPNNDVLTIDTVVAGKGTKSVSLDANGNVLFIPLPGLNKATATFTYTVKDPFGNVSEPATVSVKLGGLLQGSWRSDRLFGTDQSETIEGKGSNDALVGLDGNDAILGGTGRDTLNGGFGSDRLVGGADADLLLIRSGEDTIVLEKYSDSRLKSPDVIRVNPYYDYYSDSFYADINIDALGEQPNWLSSSPSSLVTNSLRESDIKDLLEIFDPDNNYFSLGVATFRYTDSQGKNRDFLAIDNGVLVDGHRSFSASKDSIIELQGGASYYGIFIS
jgi:Ca2+-binding RTX toxin-like protein